MSREHSEHRDGDPLAQLLVDLDEQLQRGDEARRFDTSAIADDPELLAQWNADRHCLELLHRVRRDWTPQGLDTPQIVEESFDTPANQTTSPIGRFHIQCKVGHGGLGIVYLAYDPQLHRQVALKVPRAESLVGSDMRRRFVREAEAAARLSHPNLVSVYECGDVDGTCYIAAEFCPGPNLAEWLESQDEPVPLTRAAQIVRKLAEAVQHAHGRGVLHRDIKPSNVMMARLADDQGNAASHAGKDAVCPKLTDFGMAKLLEREGMETRSGALVGTPAYMAPEQARGCVRELDARTDVYALGAILYELLTGRRVFECDSDVEALRHVLFEEPVAPRRWRREIPRDLQAICLKCLAKQPDARYVTAQDLADDLNRYLTGMPTEARPVGATARVWKWARRRPALAALAGVAMVSAVALLATVSTYNARLKEEVRRSDVARNIAQRKTEVSRRLLYAADVRLAYETYKANDVVQSLAILDRQIPTAGEADLREFSWYQLHALCNPTTMILNGHDGDVFSVAYSPDGQQLATAGKDGTVRLWDAETGNPLKVFHGHADEVTCVAYSPDGGTLASGSEDGTVRCWNPESGEAKGVVAEHLSHVMTIAFSPDGKLLASGGSEPHVQVSDVQTGRRITEFDGGLDVIRGIAFTPTGDRLFASDEQGRLVGWRSDDWSRCEQKKIPGERLFALAISADGETIACAGRRRAIFPWRLEENELDWMPVFGTDHRDWIQSLAFSPVDDRLASSGKDGIVQIGKAVETEHRTTLKGHKGRVWSAAWSPDGTQLATASGDSTARVWPLTDDGARRYPQVSSPLGNPVYSPDCSKLYTRSEEGEIHVWNTATRTLAERHPFGLEINPVVVSPDGSLLGLRTKNGAVSVHSTEDFAERFSLPPTETFYATLAWGPTGHSIITTTDEKTVAVVDMDSRATLQSFAHASSIRHLYCAAQASRLLTTSNNSLEVWDLSTGKHLRSLPGSYGEVAMSVDGSMLAANTSGNAVALWDTRHSYEMTKLVCPGIVGNLAFSPDGKTLAVDLNEPAMVSLWDIRTKQELLRLTCGLRNLHGIAFSPDGKRLVATGRDLAKKGRVLEWSIKTIGSPAY